METKKCSKCNEIKSIDDFYWKDKKANKKNSQCKICCESNRKSKEHYEKYKEAYLDRNKKRKEVLLTENRINLIEYLKTHHCVDCGESNPIMLEFDHLKREDKKYEISKMMSDYKWDQILLEISKCEVVCANHHKLRTANQFGWYKNNINQVTGSIPVGASTNIKMKTTQYAINSEGRLVYVGAKGKTYTVWGIG